MAVVAQDIKMLQVALGFSVLLFPISSFCPSHDLTLPLFCYLEITRGPLEVFARGPWKSDHPINYLLLLLLMFEMNSLLHAGRRPLPASSDQLGILIWRFPAASMVM